MPNMAGIKAEVAKIKRMVMELYDIPVILELMIETFIPTVYIPNIWVIPKSVEVPVIKT